MANLNKRSPYTKKEENELLKIPTGRGNSAAMHAHAAKYNRTYHSVWLKHRALHEGTVRTNSKKAKGITPMVFQEVDFVGKHARIDDKELISVQNGLDDSIAKGALSGTKRALLFPKKYMIKARAYLDKKYPQIAFSFHTKKGDSSNVLLARKN